jgi:tetratricopeptide (TPR) repeat protein
LLAAYEDDPGSMNSHLEACRASLAPADYALAHFAVTKFRECLSPELLLDKGKATRFLAVTLTQLALFAGKRSKDQTGTAVLSFPPVIRRVFGPFVRSGPLALAIPGGLRARMADAVARHPEGTLWLILSRQYYAEGKYREALQAAEQALSRPALLEIRPAALEAALLAEAELYFADRPNYLKPRKETVRKRLQALVAGNAVRARNCGYCSALADAVGEKALAWFIALEYTRQDPKSPHSWDLLGIMEGKLGHQARAVEMFRRALEQRPDPVYKASIETRLRQARAEARKQAQALIAAPAG